MTATDHETVPEIIKTETTRQAVIFVFSVAGIVATVWLMQELSDPDSLKTFKMRTALKVKRFAEKKVVYWQKVADDAATFYNQEKL